MQSLSQNEQMVDGLQPCVSATGHIPLRQVRRGWVVSELRKLGRENGGHRAGQKDPALFTRERYERSAIGRLEGVLKGKIDVRSERKNYD